MSVGGATIGARRTALFVVSPPPKVNRMTYFHDEVRDSFNCACCKYVWPLTSAVEAETPWSTPTCCLMCESHDDLTDNQVVLKMFFEHGEESRRRYELALEERNRMIKHNGQLRRQLERTRIELSKAMGFLDRAIARHWSKGPGEGCRCGEEHCATCNVAENSWVLERLHLRKLHEREIS